MAAGHVKNDIPVISTPFRPNIPSLNASPSARIWAFTRTCCRSLASGSRAANRIWPDYDRRDTLLVVIGRGSSDPDANSNISKITRMLWEGMGFGWAETAYTAVAAPLMADALERAHRLGFQRVVVFPYLLFTGRLVEQVRATVAAYQDRHPEVQAVVAPYLNAHPLVVETFLERLAEAERGEARMNCQFCSYRTPIVGREDWQGAPQTAHMITIMMFTITDH
jgi:sirohydrochlorin cobaltochelatase